MKKIETIPSQSKALNLKAVGDLVYEDIAMKELTEGTVLLKVKACGICSSDIERVYQNGTYHFPTVIGHEFSGQVIAVYDDENENLLGKKAAVFPLLPCMECDACKEEKYALCSNYNYFGSRCDGGFSEYLVVPVWNLVFFDQISYEEAALCEPAAVGLHASKKANIKSGDDVLIIGTGTIGFLIGIFCKNMGANVYMAGRRKESLELAEHYGFIPVMNDDTIKDNLKNASGKEFIDTVFEVVGSNESINTALSLAMKKIILVGNPKEDVVLDKQNYWRILRKELDVIGTWNSDYGSMKNDWHDVLNMIENKEIELKDFISKVYALEEYQEAVDLVKSDALTLKVMMKMDGGNVNE